jgi:hypothetical protein
MTTTRPESPAPGTAPYDPLRLCIYSTVALIAWVAGPWAVAFFALLGLIGYGRAARAGLTRSKCYLRDVRLVITYLAGLFTAGLAGIVWMFLR